MSFSQRVDVGLLKLDTGKVLPQDVNFWKKSGNEFLLSIQENCDFGNNSLENIESLYTTMMLLLTEIRHDDVVLDTLRVLFNIQVKIFFGGVWVSLWRSLSGSFTK